MLETFFNNSQSVSLSLSKTVFGCKAVLIISVLFLSCKKKDSDIPSSSITLEVFVNHHNVPVKEATVYLKSNTESFPGKDISVYDKSLATNAEGVAVFSTLLSGNFYLYSLGFDGQDSVVGSLPVILTNDMLNKTHRVNLLVSE